MTVALDTAKGKPPQSVSFVVGENSEAGEFNRFKHGYAGTIYRGQGRTLDQGYVCHSSWKSSAAYVALSRHKESVQIFAATETVRGMDKGRQGFEHSAKQATLDPAAFAAAEKAQDLAAMARGMGRKENKRAATAYRVAEAHLARAGFGLAAQEAVEPRAAHVRPPQPIQDAPRPAVAPVPGAAKNKATERAAYTGRAAPDAGTVAARGAKRFFSGLAEGIFKALMGESPAPTREPQTAQEYEQEVLQRAKAMQALSRVHGVEIKSADEARMIEESAKKRDRDRGSGGQTL